MGIVPVIGAVKYSDEVGALLKKAPNIYKNSVYKSVAECFTDGKSLKSEDEIAETVTNNLKKTQKQIEELLDDSGKFIDEEAESNYQKYVLGKQKFHEIALIGRKHQIIGNIIHQWQGEMNSIKLLKKYILLMK